MVWYIVDVVAHWKWSGSLEMVCGSLYSRDVVSHRKRTRLVCFESVSSLNDPGTLVVVVGSGSV